MKDVKTPFPDMPRFCVADSLPSYDDRMVCLVPPMSLMNPSVMSIFFKEFIHCQQAEKCEEKLVSRLGVYQKAEAKMEFLWELHHEFPYMNDKVRELYQSFMDAQTPDEASVIRQKLPKKLKPHDYEYMVLIEWKEGFAHLIDNRI